ncbi:TPA: helix-turn-helix domain-containing protein [Providencia stuartii]|uniref:transcriptional regulator n=1 Tax=Morganellaceae TaxID=1903414 RepID=UPI0012B53002|nr:MULTISPECIES: YdaS family helix-turn-helix protein [Morganellaceae]EKX9073917.1 helix-turn-helix domain-containing protein [Proteus mirabilis]MBG2772824.1 helix-turn-helix domain-containing protein [Proteus mirabilis]MBG2933446.1 helix-turn-helix domain-containing protein [Proteus mirabilis]MBG3121048.1 helix-turn-helix domain-containing protein [Proteus mirabilis]MBG3135347.1 helix-turn-helix domain-containing protein [Proteus mirabilis]
MELKKYIDSLEWGGAKALADQLGVSKSYLSQMASGLSSISPKRCVEIELATNGAVTRMDLRPNDWNEIWPELEVS